MGEWIRDLSYFKIGNTDFKIELNEAYGKGNRYDIHLQCGKGRMGLTESEFVQLAACFVAAKKQFLRSKEMDADE